jgi:hypothetical protein
MPDLIRVLVLPVPVEAAVSVLFERSPVAGRLGERQIRPGADRPSE